MVHYLVPQRAEETAPSSCPKCGSHRTEAAGRSENGRGIDVRCHDCDERFSMLIDRRASDGDNMTDEIEAIRAVGRALARLSDPASRARVLRWATERFQIDAAVTPAAVPARPPVKAAAADGPDLTLSTDSLFDFFPAPTERERARLESDSLAIGPDPLVQAVPPVDETRVEDARPSGSTLRSFVSDFQRLASDCQTLFPTTADAPQ